MPPEQRIPALRNLYASSTPATVVDAATALVGLTGLTSSTRTALETFAAAGSWNHARAVGVLHLLLSSPDFFVN